MSIEELLNNELRFGAASAKKEIDGITNNVNELDNLITKFGKTNDVSERSMLVGRIGGIVEKIRNGNARIYNEVDRSNENANRLLRAANNCRSIED